MQYVDTHVHLDSLYEKLKKNFDDSFDDYCATFPEGFDGCLCVYSSCFDYSMKFIGSNHPKIFGALGQHPHDAKCYDEAFEAKLIELLKHEKIRSLGEIGLDYYYAHSPVDVQKRVFERQCHLAVERQLPVTIHTRDAEDDTFDIIKRCLPKDQKIHIHCYTNSWEAAERILKEFPNAYFGFTGCITFKNSANVQDVCKKIPLDKILSETDGPFMAPVPFRGKPSNPGYIPIIIKKIAELHQVSEECAFTQLRENCRRVYNF